ncbi:hypothetical protein C0995_013848 [Termitomyces sp. Mi166|nr:hypothetical protein C0995_013848 [Termitomyces sp. Mi166\
MPTASSTEVSPPDPSYKTLPLDPSYKIPSWKDTRDVKEVLKELNDPNSQWARGTRGFHVYAMNFFKAEAQADDDERTIRLFAFLRRNIRKEDNTKYFQSAVIIFEKILWPSETIPGLFDRGSAALCRTGTGHTSTATSPEDISRDNFPHHTATLLYITDAKAVVPILAIWRARHLEYYEFSEGSQPDMKTLFAAASLIIQEKCPELEKRLPHQDWFPALIPTVLYKPPTLSKIFSSLLPETTGKNSEQGLIHSPWEKKYKKELRQLTAGLRRTLEELRRDGNLKSLLLQVTESSQSGTLSDRRYSSSPRVIPHSQIHEG